MPFRNGIHDSFIAHAPASSSHRIAAANPFTKPSTPWRRLSAPPPPHAPPAFPAPPSPRPDFVPLDNRSTCPPLPTRSTVRRDVIRSISRVCRRLPGPTDLLLASTSITLPCSPPPPSRKLTRRHSLLLCALPQLITRPEKHICTGKRHLAMRHAPNNMLLFPPRRMPPTNKLGAAFSPLHCASQHIVCPAARHFEHAS